MFSEQYGKESGNNLLTFFHLPNIVQINLASQDKMQL